MPRGGPDGGDGGKGGDITLVADTNKNTLIEFQHSKRFEAENGKDGESATRAGRSGKSLIIRVPVGTSVRDKRTGALLVDLVFDQQEYVICKGGMGGRGNVHFANSVRQAPTFAEKGQPGEAKQLILELKLLADVGIIGLPNAGKSTLISAVSAAKPKIGDYPFTTITPNLGIVKVGEFSFVMADLPGLIQGASEGKGLGLQFLKHAERTQALVHLVECLPMDGSDPVQNFKLIEEELAKYSAELAAKPRIVVISKCDLAPDSAALSKIEGDIRTLGHEVFRLSAATRSGLDAFLYRLAELVKNQQESRQIKVVQPAPVSARSGAWAIHRVDDYFVLEGETVERMVAMTDMDNDEAVQYLHRRLTKLGVIRALRDEGAKEGDTVVVGEREFSFVE